jgi:hypothetical protein
MTYGVTAAFAIVALVTATTAVPAMAGQKFVFTSTRHIPDDMVDSSVQAATTDAQGYETRQFRRCMLRLGWRYSRVTRISTPDQSYDDELEKRNEDASNDAERQRDEEARRDE